jgi:AcrR family transcriptional regulator
MPQICNVKEICYCDETVETIVSSSGRETSLERALAAKGDPAPKPLDVLEAARRIWLEGRRLEMGALAAGLGLSRATLYRWVGSKERLLGEVAWSFALPVFEEARTQASGQGADYIAEVVERYLRSAIAFAALRRFVEQDPEYALKVLTSKHSSMQRRSVAATRELLEEQVRAGALEPPLDLDTLAYVIVRIAESFLYSDVITGTEPDIDKGCEAIDALLHAPPPRRQPA